MQKYPNKAFITQDSNVSMDKRQNYCILYCLRPMVSDRSLSLRVNSDKESFEKYMPVINYGVKNTDTNYISDVKFSKTNSPGLREARYFNNANGSLTLLSNVYDLSFSF